MSYVLTVALQDSSDWFYAELSQLLFAKHLGELRTSGKDIPFLSRILQRDESGIHLQAPKSHIKEGELLGLGNGKPVSTTGTSSPTRKEDGTSHVGVESHRISRRVVGKLLWIVPRRPDWSCVAKELHRTRQPPTQEDYARLGHSIRYLKGMENYRMSIGPTATTNCVDIFDDTTFVDSDWAGCAPTKNSTTGCTIPVRGVHMHHYSRTQSTVARSSREAELCGLSSGTTETMGVRVCLRECNDKTNSYVTICTIPTAGQPMASRLRAKRATKHIQLWYLYIQEMIATGVVHATGIVRRWKVPTKDNLADLHAILLPVEEIRHVCELRCLRLPTVH